MARKKKPDPLPPVIKVEDLQRSYPQQLAQALDPYKVAAAAAFTDALLSSLKRIEALLKKIEHSTRIC